METPLMPCTVFWDFENCQVPKGIKGYQVVVKIKDFITKNSLQMTNITAIGNPASLGTQTMLELQESGVALQLCTTGKPSAADITILGEIMKTIYINRPPYCIVLISGDRDFSKILNYLVGVQYRVILVYSNEISPVLLHSTREAISWVDFLNKDHRTVVVANTSTISSQTSNATQAGAFNSSSHNNAWSNISTAASSISLSKNRNRVETDVPRLDTSPARVFTLPAPHNSVSGQHSTSINPQPATGTDPNPNTYLPKYALDLIQVLKSAEKSTLTLSDLGTVARGLFKSHGFANWKDYVFEVEKLKCIKLIGKNDRNGNLIITLNKAFSSSIGTSQPKSPFKELEELMERHPQGADLSRVSGSLHGIHAKKGFRNIKEYLIAAEVKGIVKISDKGRLWKIKPCKLKKISPTPSFSYLPIMFQDLAKFLVDYPRGTKGSIFGSAFPKIYLQYGFESLTKYLIAAEDAGACLVEVVKEFTGDVLIKPFTPEAKPVLVEKRPLNALSPSNRFANLSVEDFIDEASDVSANVHTNSKVDLGVMKGFQIDDGLNGDDDLKLTAGATFIDPFALSAEKLGETAEQLQSTINPNFDIPKDFFGEKKPDTFLQRPLHEIPEFLPALKSELFRDDATNEFLDRLALKIVDETDNNLTRDGVSMKDLDESSNSEFSIDPASMIKFNSQFMNNLRGDLLLTEKHSFAGKVASSSLSMAFQDNPEAAKDVKIFEPHSLIIPTDPIIAIADAKVENTAPPEIPIVSAGKNANLPLSNQESVAEKLKDLEIDSSVLGVEVAAKIDNVVLKKVNDTFKSSESTTQSNFLDKGEVKEMAAKLSVKEHKLPPKPSSPTKSSSFPVKESKSLFNPVHKSKIQAVIKPPTNVSSSTRNEISTPRISSEMNRAIQDKIQNLLSAAKLDESNSKLVNGITTNNIGPKLTNANQIQDHDPMNFSETCKGEKNGKASVDVARLSEESATRDFTVEARSKKERAKDKNQCLIQ